MVLWRFSPIKLPFVPMPSVESFSPKKNSSLTWVSLDTNHPAFHWEALSITTTDTTTLGLLMEGYYWAEGDTLIREEKTLEPGINSAIEKALKEDIASLIAPGVAVEIDYLWSGVMAFGSSKQPVINA